MPILNVLAALAVMLPLTLSARGQEANPQRTEINKQAEILAETELLIDASPEAVWAVLTDVDSWTQWLPEFASARLDGPLAAGTTLFWEPQGQTVESRLITVEPARLLIWNGSGGAVHVWQLTPHGDGTMLRNDESIDDWAFPGDHDDQSAFLAGTLQTWNTRLAERVASKAK